MITKVTVTGADDSIEPKALAELFAKYPFVEWGILVSKNNVGKARFPSVFWIQELMKTENVGPLSCHLCGTWVRELAKGNIEAIVAMKTEVWDKFARVQLNFHAIPHLFSVALGDVVKNYPNKEFIFQFDQVNNDGIIKALVANGQPNVAVLFDKSGGAGVLPDEWPDHMPDGTIRCGYAGGLSPDNVVAEIQKIEAKAGPNNIWIDVETHVRSNDDALFDLEKVERFLEACKPYVQSGVEATA